MDKCHYPHCKKLANRLWALVPLCDQHYEDIRDETKLYYERPGASIKYEERTEYLKIAHLIPWSMVSQGMVNIK